MYVHMCSGGCSEVLQVCVGMGFQVWTLLVLAALGRSGGSGNSEDATGETSPKLRFFQVSLTLTNWRTRFGFQVGCAS